ncbi:uncharacterized protein LOC141910315 [Tubulanus polymorphus]|uniref:uncharacterized protein LOC141910315 n=1 Tax=Tubulanus polymorphus TaxID=672921 RepID=UPI003DA62C38
MAVNRSWYWVSNCTIKPPITTKYFYHIVFYAGICGPIALAGLVLNSLSIAVFARLNNKAYHSINILAIVDMIYSTNSFFMYPVRAIYVYAILGDLVFRWDDWRFGWEFIVWTWPLLWPLHLLRNGCVVVVSVERVLVIVFPLKYHKFWKRWVIDCIVSMIAVFGFIIYINLMPNRLPGLWKWPCLKPKQFAYTVYWRHNPPGVIKTPVIQFRRGEFIPKFPFNHRAVFNGVLPISILISINFVLLAFYFRSKYQRSKLTATQSKSTSDMALFRMVVAVVFAYIALEIPTVANSIGPLAKIWSFKQFGQKIAMATSWLNSVVNFTIYCATNKKFRATAKEIFKKPKFICKCV